MQVQLRNRDWSFFAPVPKKNLFGACSPPPKPGLGRETASCSTKKQEREGLHFSQHIPLRSSQDPVLGTPKHLSSLEAAQNPPPPSPIRLPGGMCPQHH